MAANNSNDNNSNKSSVTGRRRHHRTAASIATTAATTTTTNRKKNSYRHRKAAQPAKHRRDRTKRKQQQAKYIALNKQLIACQSSHELLTLLAEITTTTTTKTTMKPSTSSSNDNDSSNHGGGVSVVPCLTKLAGGSGTLNGVNFSTSLHRLARFCSTDDTVRRSTLLNPKFALLMCSLAEFMAIGGGENDDNSNDDDDGANGLSLTASTTDWKQTLSTRKRKNKDNHDKAFAFTSRQCSNIAWSIAKLKLAPPQSAFALTAVALDNDDDDDDSNDDDDMYHQNMITLMETSLKIRSQVLEGQRSATDNRKSQQQQAARTVWIPTLSILAGRILDTVSYHVFRLLSSSQAQHQLTSQEGANLLWALATTQRAHVDVFERITINMIDNLQQQQQQQQTASAFPLLPPPQELSNSIYSYAKAGIVIDNENVCGPSLLLSYTDQLFEDHPSFIDEWKTQEISNFVWSMATILSKRSNHRGDGGEKSHDEDDDDRHALHILRVVVRAITDRVDDFKTQELSNFCWAMATLGFGEEEGSANALNEYVYLKTDDFESDRLQMIQAMHAVAAIALPRLHMFRSQELNNLAWSFARLGRTEYTNLYTGIGRELCRPKRSVDGQDVGTTLWAFATLLYFDEDVYRAILSKVNAGAAQKYRPVELSNICWACGTSAMTVKYPDAFDITLLPPNHLRSFDYSDDPVTVCFAIAANELMRRPHEFKSQEIKDITWSFSRVGVRHPVLFKAVAEYLVGKESDTVPAGELHCGKGMDTFTSQGIGNLLWSYAKQGQLAAETMERLEELRGTSSGRLFIFSTICCDVGETLIKRLFNLCAESFLNMFDSDDLATPSPQDLSNTAWSFCVAGLLHTRFFEAVAHQVIRRLSDSSVNDSDFNEQEISNVVYACASLNCRYPKILDAISTYVCRLCEQPNGRTSARSIAQHFKQQELANIAWSCAVMGHYPPDLMELLYTGLVGMGDDERNPSYMAQVSDEGGMQPQTVMTLLYVQMAIDFEWPDNDLTLPESFPDGWIETGTVHDTSSEGDDDNGLTTELSLSTSRTQSDVSNAFDRVGFSHVQEHVMTMDDLVHNHGIQLSSKPLELMSIDIANVQDKVGIEVDGPSHFCTVLDTWSPQEEAKGYAKRIGGRMEYEFQWDGRQRINGSTALKDRLLEKLGWRLFHIPFWEWYAMRGDASKENEYCSNLLKGND